MKRFKRILFWSGSTFLFLTVVLALHIYLVTRPKVDAHTRVLARIDVRQLISPDASAKITTWLYNQKGVDHVMCNVATENVVFSYSPLLADGNQIASNFRQDLNYPHSSRFIPSEKDLQGSCPVAASSFTYKVYKVMKNIF